MATISTSETLSAAGAKTSEKRLLILSCFLSIYVIWGSTYLAIRYAVETIPPLYTAGIRHLWPGSILLDLGRWRRGCGRQGSSFARAW